ncbi:MAG: GTP-binding protein [Oscillospiraceae bacterium]
MNDLPVYLFVGFMGAGKTRFIQEILADADFCTSDKVLLLICEGSESDYNPSLFLHDNVVMHCVKNERDLTPEYLSTLEEKHNPKRIIVEYNGAWWLPTIYSAMPKHWFVFQNLCIANSIEFPLNAVAMPDLCSDKLEDADIVLFNRCQESTNKHILQTFVRGANKDGDIIYENINGGLSYDKKDEHEHQATKAVKISGSQYDIFHTI